MQPSPLINTFLRFNDRYTGGKPGQSCWRREEGGEREGKGSAGSCDPPKQNRTESSEDGGGGDSGGAACNVGRELRERTLPEVTVAATALVSLLLSGSG